MRISKEEPEVKRIEGYIDEKRRVFVCTNDHGLLGDNDFKKVERNEVNKELLAKFKPDFK